MELIMDAIRAVRTRRAEMNVPPSKKASFTVATQETAVFAAGIPFLKRLAGASEVKVVSFREGPSDAEAQQAGLVSITTHAARVFIPLGELVDLAKEKARVEKELGKHTKELEKLDAKLNNPGFVNKAPASVVEAEKERADKLRILIDSLTQQLASF